VASPRRAYVAFRLLAAVTSAVCFLVGILFLAAFCDRTLFQVFARPLFDTNFWGYYVAAFAGAVSIAWGGCLLAAARDPEGAGGIATATAAGLIVGSVVRLLAWYSGEFRSVGEQMRLEAGVFAVVALAFVWLKPPRTARR
jgi:hypothetical protein